MLPLLTSGDVLLTRRNGPDLRLSIAPDEPTTPSGVDEPTAAMPADMPGGDTDIPEVSDAIDAVDDGDARRGSSDPVLIELGALLAGLVRVADRRRLATMLASACPWMVDLPPAARRRFVAEVAASAAPDDDDLRGPGDVLDQWRQTSQMFVRA